MIKKITLLSLLGLLGISAFADVNSQAIGSDAQANVNAVFQALPKYTIKAGSHTAAQNAEHQKYCAQFGDKDITDTIDIQVGYDNVNPMDSTVFCMGSGTLDTGSGLAGVGVLSSNNPADSLSGTISSSGVSSIQPSPINGSVPLESYYWIQAYATYNYTMGGRPKVAIDGYVNETDCVAAGADYIIGSSGHILARRECAPASGFPGSRATTDIGSITGPYSSYRSEPGQINFYNN